MDRKKKVGGGKDCSNSSSISCSESQNNNQSNNSSGCLPEDVMFNILIRHPAEWIRSSAKFTCKSLAAMIRRSDFVETQGLHMVPISWSSRGNGEYGITALSPQLPGQYLNSCDGLILFYQKATGDLHVVNPVTMQTLNVPKLLIIWIALQVPLFVFHALANSNCLLLWSNLSPKFVIAIGMF